jgi:hypothetical protein
MIRWLSRFIDARRHPPQRFQLLGRWYHLGARSGAAWQRTADPHGPITFTYYPEWEPRRCPCGDEITASGQDRCVNCRPAPSAPEGEG